MSAALEKFFQAVKEFTDLNSRQAAAQAEYKAALTSAQGQKVCSKAFQQVLEELDAKAEALNSILSQYNPKKNEIVAAFNELGFFEKRDSSITSQYVNSANLAKGIRSEQEAIIAQKPTRQELRQQYNSCQDLDENENQEEKDAGETDAENEDEPKDAENQEPDDKNGSSGTTPSQPNDAGQKSETDQGTTTTPGSSTPQGGATNAGILTKPNPLGDYSSYTYNLTLYMVTPEAYNKYLTNMELPREGVYIIAQSGGMNPTEARLLTLEGEPGPSKAGLDYFIDDLKLSTVYPGKHGQQSATVATKINFKIYEPQGFGFLPRLARASQEVIKRSEKLKTKKQKPLPFQMLYILGARFMGYDSEGNIKKASESDKGYGQFGGYSAYERFFPLMVSAVKTKLDGRVTTYDWTGVVTNERFAFGQKNSAMKSKASVEASSVEDAIGSYAIKNKKSLLGGLNAEQEDLKQKKDIEYPIVYEVEYEPDSPIKKAKLLDDAEYSKAMAAMSEAQTPQDVTPKLSIKATAINTTSKMLEIPQGMSIVSVIDQFITKSSYVTDSLSKVNNQRIQTQSIDKPSVTELDWFVVHPKVEVQEWDEKTNDWSLKITFQIKTYKVPYVRTQYAERKSKYYGPVKLYEYWFTGGNKEVLSYEQTFNSLYYIIQPYSVNQDDSLSDDQTNTVPVSPASTPAGNDVVGKANGGSKINENVRDSVYNEADQYKAQVRIMGDPDFLMETIGGSLDFSRGSSSDLFKQFYHKRGSINPYGGQVFCEIVFYISEDYASNDTGLQEINNQLTFYGSAKTQKILKNKGVIYQLLRVDSVFRRGQFHQTLELLIVPPGQLIQKNTVEGATDQRDANQTGAESARLLRQAGYDTNQTNQSAAVAFRSGVQLNSQAGAGRGSINPPLANPDARQSSVEASKPVPVSLEDPVSGQPVSGSTAPLANTQVVTPGRDGQPVNNDDAAANTSRTVPVPQGGREQTPAGGETTPTREPEPGP